MGSESDWETMKNAATTLQNLHVSYEVKIVSAHRFYSLSIDEPELLRGYSRMLKQLNHEGFALLLLVQVSFINTTLMS